MFTNYAVNETDNTEYQVTDLLDILLSKRRIIQINIIYCEPPNFEVELVGQWDQIIPLNGTLVCHG
jgi:hypothetical protein